MIFSKVRVVQPSPQSSFKTFSSPRISHVAVCTLPPATPGKHESASCLCSLPVLYISCSKWDHITRGLFLLAFTYRNVFEVRPCCDVHQSVLHFLLPESILLYDFRLFCLYIHLLVDIWVFHFLAFINNVL